MSSNSRLEVLVESTTAEITAVILSQLNAKPKKVEPSSEDEDPIPVSK